MILKMQSATLFGDKKGEEGSHSFIVKVILLVVVLVICMYIVWLIRKQTEATSQDAICKASVRANAIRNFKEFDSFVVSDIKCPPKKFIINTGDEEEIYKVIANATYDCWDRFGEGRYNIFNVARGHRERFCIICAYIDFEGEARDKLLKNLTAYMMAHRIPRFRDKRSYYEFIYGVSPTIEDYEDLNKLARMPVEDFLEEELPFPFINTSLPYTVLLVYGKERGFWDKWLVSGLSAIGGFVFTAATTFLTGGSTTILSKLASIALKAPFRAAIGAGAGFIGGPSADINWSYGIVVSPFSEEDILEQQCTKLG